MASTTTSPPIVAGNTVNKCKDLASTKSIPVVSFCNKQSMELNSPITLDAYQPSFGASASFCMCEVKILSTQTFSSLRVSQENTLVPPIDCGLQIQIANATQIIRTVQCSNVGDTEYILYPGSSIVISLVTTSTDWSEGFCFHLSMRFENSPIGVQCFNPGVTIVPSQPYTTGRSTPTTSTTLSAVTNTSFLPSTTNTDSSTVTYVTSNEKSDVVTATSSTESRDSTQTEFSKTLPTTSKQSSITTTMVISPEKWTPRETSTASMSSIQVPSTYIPTITTVKSQSPSLTSSSWKYTIPAIGGLIILTFSIAMAVCYKYRNNRKNMIKNTNSSNVNLPYSRDFTYEN
ncbi:mucin-5AC-like [Crassostrea angulata]|uniref:mucin-5AC-like n=1 Tax=Magallana angulata TaxID=2784310 RepID=UPI0022B13109|nr:mucin-5AC-like [Crassostrea angulata]